MSYRIYRNLHRRDWTIQHYVKGKGWRKLRSADAFAAGYADFVIYETGRNRARDERRKNVHAFAIVGRIGGNILTPCEDDWSISYNPYDDHGFRAVRRNDPSEFRSNLTRAMAPIFGADGQIYAVNITTNNNKEQAA